MVIVDESSSTDVVAIGCKVTVKGPAGEAAYAIVGSQEADPMHGIISEESPLRQGFDWGQGGRHCVRGGASGRNQLYGAEN